MSSFTLWFSGVTFLTALTTAGFAWYVKQSITPGSGVYRMQHKRMMRRKEGAVPGRSSPGSLSS